MFCVCDREYYQDIRLAVGAGCVIVLVVSASTGVLVMLGWTLGPIESIIFSVAVGLSVDFAAHLSHAFKWQVPDLPLSASLLYTLSFGKRRFDWL